MIITRLGTVSEHTPTPTTHHSPHPLKEKRSTNYLLSNLLHFRTDVSGVDWAMALLPRATPQTDRESVCVPMTCTLGQAWYVFVGYANLW